MALGAKSKNVVDNIAEYLIWLDSGASKWYLIAETFDNLNKKGQLKNVSITEGDVEGPFGDSAKITHKANLECVIGSIEVHRVDGIKENLASISQMLKERKTLNIIINTFGVFLYDGILTAGTKIGTLEKEGLYSIDKSFFNTKRQLALKTGYRFKNRARTAHLRLGCISAEYLRKAKRYNSLNGLNYTEKELQSLQECPCDGCVAKANAQPTTSRTRNQNQTSDYRKFGARELRGYKLNEWCIDLSGPIPTSRENFKHVIYFLHLRTNYAIGYGARAKSDYPKILEHFMKEHEFGYPQGKEGRETIHLTTFSSHWTFEGTVSRDRIKMIRIDNATELNSVECKAIYRKYGIDKINVAPFDHYGNPCERLIQSVNKIAVSLLALAKFNDKQFAEFYYEATKEAFHIHNCRPNAGIDYMTPYEKRFGVKPHVDWIRCWGSTAYILNDPQHRPDGKYSRRFEVGVVMGLNRTTQDFKHPLYRVYLPHKNRFYSRRNVIADETYSHSSHRIAILRCGDFYLDTSSNKHNQVLIPKVLPKYNSLEKWNWTENASESYFTQQVNEDEAEYVGGPVSSALNTIANVRRKYLLKQIIGRTISAKIKARALVNLAPLRSKILMYNALAKLKKIPRRSRRTRIPKVLLAYEAEYSAEPCSRYPTQRDSKPHKIEFAGFTKSEDGKETLELKISKKCRLAMRIKFKERDRKSEKAKSLTPAVKLSDWDNPDLAWAKLRDDWPLWQKAIEIELNNLETRGTWRQLYPDEDPNRVLDTKLVLKIKRHPDGTVDKYKARLTARGFLQQFGADYIYTRSPVTTNATFRMVLAHAKLNKRRLMLVDFAAAFLYPLLKEEIYLKVPNLCSDAGKIVKLLKTLYGLKQASYEWNKQLSQALIKMGFKQISDDIDECLFVHKEWDIIMCTHVDDCIVSFTDKGTKDPANKGPVSKMLKTLEKAGFEYTETEKVVRALGVQIIQEEDHISLCQPAYVENVLKDYELQECTPRNSPPAKWLEPRPQDEEKVDEETYRSIVGCLSYLAQTTRPDIEQFTFHLATFVSDPGTSHWKAIVHLLGYLKKFPDKGIRFTVPENPKDPLQLWKFYVDSDFAGDIQTRKSTTGYICSFMSGPLITSSKRQRLTALSSTEAEYVGFVEIIRDIKWLRKLANVLKIPFPRPAPIRNDNLTAQNIAENKAKLKRTKHIDTRYHFVKECIELGVVSLIHVPRKNNISDMLTHPLGPTEHKRQRQLVMNWQERQSVKPMEKALSAIITQSTKEHGMDNIQRALQAQMYQLPEYIVDEFRYETYRKPIFAT